MGKIYISITRINVMFLIFFMISCGNKYEKEYFSNGNLKSEIELKNNQYHGIGIFYKNNGEIDAKVKYYRGEKTSCEFYYESGTVEQLVSYLNGETMSIRNFDEEGNLIYNFHKIEKELIPKFKEEYFNLRGVITTVEYTQLAFKIPNIPSSQVRALINNGNITVIDGGFWKIKGLKKGNVVLTIQIQVSENEIIDYGKLMYEVK